jgi:hypothetical protein
MPDLPSGFNPLLVHQVHPGKLAADITASVVSSALLWRGRLLCGLVVHYLVPPLGSALVLARADLARLAGWSHPLLGRIARRFAKRNRSPSRVAYASAKSTWS